MGIGVWEACDRGRPGGTEAAVAPDDGGALATVPGYGYAILISWVDKANMPGGKY